MDALERLKEKNQKHKKLIDTERKANLKVLPALVLFLAAYFGVIYYTGDFTGEYNPSELQEMARHLWLLSTVFCFGLGAFFFVNACVLSIYVDRLAKFAGRNVRTFNIISKCLRRLLIAAFFGYLGIWLSNLIVENDNSIAKALRFGFDTTPFLVQMLAIGLILLVGAVISIAIFFLLSLPSQAKKDAEEFLRMESGREI